MHKFFRGVDWDDVQNKRIEVPWVPIVDNEKDVKWFDRYPESKE